MTTLSIDTSTALTDPAEPELRSGLGTELAHLVFSDWHAEYPLRTAQVIVTPTARVYEIHEPADWHRLVLTYGPSSAHDSHLADENGIDDGPGPNWSGVAADWDGVHLSFFGHLTTINHPMTSGGIATTLTNWRSERTLWLRPAFSHVLDAEAISHEPRSQLHPLSHG